MGTCTRLLCSSLLLPTLGDHLHLPSRIPSPPPCFLCSPSLPRACSPPPLLAALGSSNLGSPGDGKRARGALQLWSRGSFLPRCPEPPPPLSPPGYLPPPATLLGQRRHHHRQPSSRPRRAALTRPGWSFPSLGSVSTRDPRGSGTGLSAHRTSLDEARRPPAGYPPGTGPWGHLVLTQPAWNLNPFSSRDSCLYILVP